MVAKGKKSEFHYLSLLPPCGSSRTFSINKVSILLLALKVNWFWNVFLVFSILPKNQQKNWLNYYDTLGRNVHYLEEFKKSKRLLQINGPLTSRKKESVTRGLLDVFDYFFKYLLWQFFWLWVCYGPFNHSQLSDCSYVWSFFTNTYHKHFEWSELVKNQITIFFIG